MSKTPPWTVDSDAYLADTSHLSGATQHGAYLLIMLAMWRSPEGVLADDDVTLARAAHLTLDKWRRMAPVIRPLLQPITSGITQKRLRRDKLAANRTGAESERPSQNPSQNPGTPSKSLESKAPDSGGGSGPETALSLNLTLQSEDSKEGK